MRVILGRRDRRLEFVRQIYSSLITRCNDVALYSFLRDLKTKCSSKPGNPAFWKAVKEVGRDLSLISNQEAKRQGGQSDITENEAGEVCTIVLTADLITNIYSSSFLDVAV